MIRVLQLKNVDGKPVVTQLLGDEARTAVSAPPLEPGTLRIE